MSASVLKYCAKLISVVLQLDTSGDEYLPDMFPTHQQPASSQSARSEDLRIARSDIHLSDEDHSLPSEAFVITDADEELINDISPLLPSSTHARYFLIILNI